MGCRSGILVSHRLVDSLAFRFTAKAFRALPKALTTSFPVRSNQKAFHKVVTCRTASVSASDDVRRFDIQTGSYLKGYSEKIKICNRAFLVLLRIYIVSRTCLLSHQKIQTLMAVAFIAEHRTRAVGDVIKSLGEERSPVPRHGGSVKGLDNEVLEVTLCLHMNGYVEKAMDREEKSTETH
ncbi:PREDICTED: nudix hydrolase 20 chloroplastic [Prunus dulcis]|uniref:PREDICTED: nudix hydrolase 20 chloroplastic n=1 Tax=Prunus dulcis TaxID=3755 RepID=A0A5E4G6W4_PRUDU|nr:hypothetical protein L3X38_021938 [Prunus dulcis]VVA35292.1 PREDICTED: nudix hydrolase 20 chloroplastic [Prunus dulcis]